MSEEIVYRNMDGLNVTSCIDKGETKLFSTWLEAYEYATLKRSYTYQVQIRVKGNFKGYGYAVPK